MLEYSVTPRFRTAKPDKLFLRGPCLALRTLEITFSRRSFAGLATASVFATGTTVTAQARAGRVVQGLDVLLGPKRGLLAGKRVGLITNPTGVTVKLESAIDRMAQ
eukprot:gene34955-57824_t